MSKVIKGDVWLFNLYLKKIPDIFQDVEVRSSFGCWINQLTSLEGGPKYVGGHFLCHNNQISSLKGAPKRVGGSFNCHSNHLTSLEGAPEYVGGHFYCFNNTVKFTKEQVRAVCKVEGHIYV